MKERLKRFWESVTRFFLGLYSKAIRKPKMSEARRKRRAAYKTKYTRSKTNGISAFLAKSKAFGQKVCGFFVEVNAKLKMKWERFMNRHKKMSWLTYARAVSLMAAIVVLVFTPVAIFAGAQEDKEQKTQQDEARVLAQAEEKKASEKLSVTGVEVLDGEPSAEPSPEPTPEPTPEPKVKEPLAEGMENAELVPNIYPGGKKSTNPTKATLGQKVGPFTEIAPSSVDTSGGPTGIDEDKTRVQTVTGFTTGAWHTRPVL